MVRDVVVGKLLHLVHHLDWLGLVLIHTERNTDSLAPHVHKSVLPVFQFELRFHLVDFKEHLFGVCFIKAIQPVPFEVNSINQS